MMVSVGEGVAFFLLSFSSSAKEVWLNLQPYGGSGGMFQFFSTKTGGNI